VYDAWALELVAQQKCCYHIIRSIDKVLEDKAWLARAFGETLKTSFKDGIALWRRHHTGEVDDYTREAQNITQAIAVQSMGAREYAIPHAVRRRSVLARIDLRVLCPRSVRPQLRHLRTSREYAVTCGFGDSLMSVA